VARTGIGNGQWEGGITAGTNIVLTPSLLLTFSPEIDILADRTDPGRRHVQMQQVINLGKSLNPRLMLYGELWTAQNYDPAGSVRQYSADTALAWVVRPSLQLDLGANFGLNRATPATQVYAGISARF
jgi:hypothetical protein